MISRRRFIQAAAASLAVGLGFSDIHYWEPGWLELTQHRIAFFKDQGPPFKILFLADLHYSRFVPLPLISEAIALGVAQKPDLILLGGDYVLFDMPLNFSAFSDVLSPLAECAPTFACYGNHDRPVGTQKNRLIGEALTSAGITVLFNQATVIATHKRQFELAGTGDLWAGQCKPPPAGEVHIPRLILAHNPDSKDVMHDEPWDLMLCGHTHGGQLRIPFVGEPFAPVEDKRYVAGLNAYGKRQIYTTRGVGSLYGLRLNCRPEVTMLELV
ncbi:phosphodiesterase YaeI [Escherichia coli]|uniref:phosphodiesterase YaeI n=1 Tax=Escherichia sp. MOD1-EC7003 TaxID=2093900 RepID=UPI000CF7889D|nr:phosphodiesterase YaeI [Escherichia sp. MOD1-EC7003]EGO8358888.1 phosphodiesterase YaeI [Escherichia coli]EGO8376112.1 phosphodiesterase YaeI [Escherichia coli]MCH0693107.1 phosphodiesterase YaeI [Escherichia coli]